MVWSGDPLSAVRDDFWGNYTPFSPYIPYIAKGRAMSRVRIF